MMETKILKLIRIFLSPRNFALTVLAHTSPLWPDELFLKIKFRLNMGKRLNLKNPKTFNEKLQWLKLYDRKPEYTLMADKYAVKKYVSSLIGEEYIIPTLGVWDKVEDIEWDQLPDQFVIKCTHDSGGVIICRDKKTIDKEKTMKKLNKSLRNNYYLSGREWPYKNIPRRIIAEKYIEPAPNTKDLPDYKFFCFNGKVKCFKIDFNRQIDHHANYYDIDGNLLPFGEVEYPRQPNKHLEIPTNLSQMVILAETIASGHVFLRVDFYNHQGKIYFGEITFFPASGTGKIEPEEWDHILGEWLAISNISKR